MRAIAGAWRGARAAAVACASGHAPRVPSREAVCWRRSVGAPPSTQPLTTAATAAWASGAGDGGHRTGRDSTIHSWSCSARQHAAARRRCSSAALLAAAAGRPRPSRHSRAACCCRHLCRCPTAATATTCNDNRLSSPRRLGLRARVAQFRQVTGSNDPNGHHDLEVGPTDVDPQSLGGLPLATAAADAAAVLHVAPSSSSGAAAVNGSSSSGAAQQLAAADKLTQEVEQQLRRRRLEALWGAGPQQAAHAGDSSGDDAQAAHAHAQQQPQQLQHSAASYGTIADDELLPLLAEAAAHPEQLQHVPPQQQRAGSGSDTAATAVAAAAAAPQIVGGIPRSILVLSMVSMALTSASCVFNTLLPIYMVTELKMTMRTMGMFEGARAGSTVWQCGAGRSNLAGRRTAATLHGAWQAPARARACTKCSAAPVACCCGQACWRRSATWCACSAAC